MSVSFKCKSGLGLADIGLKFEYSILVNDVYIKFLLSFFFLVFFFFITI